MAHAKVVLIAAAFGVAAYAVTLGLLHISRLLGLLDWLH
jgi:hypothetical protein